jgi:CelD/BcsL family acetyltransferase involved in cellulose biosynthesis
VTAWHAETFRRVEDLDSIRESWEALGIREPTADPEHFTTVLANRPEAVRPHVVRLERDGEPVALVVGRIEDIELTARIGYRKILSPRLRALTVVQAGYLGDASEATAERMLSELTGALDAGEADVLRLRLLEVGTPLHRLARTTPGGLRRERHSRPSTRWQADIPDSFDAFLAARSKSQRGNIRYTRKRIQTELRERARLETFHDTSDLERLYRDASLLAQKTYQHGLGASFQDDPLRRALTELGARRGWHRAYVLYVDDEPVAFWFATAFNGIVQLGYTGYDPAYRDLGVGAYALSYLIEEACEDPELHVLDHGYGDADYKRRLSDRSWLEEDVLVYAGSWKGVRTNVGRTAVLGTAKLGQRALRDRDSVMRVKRWWRDRLRSGES